MHAGNSDCQDWTFWRYYLIPAKYAPCALNTYHCHADLDCCFLKPMKLQCVTVKPVKNAPILIKIFRLMRAISINIDIGMCSHVHLLISIEGPTLNILNTGSECGDLRWSENGCLKAGALPLPKSSNSGRQPRSSFFPPSHILNILRILNIFNTWFRSVSYWFYSIYLTYILADNKDLPFPAISPHSLTVEKTNNGPDERKGANLPVLNSVKWGWRSIS